MVHLGFAMEAAVQYMDLVAGDPSSLTTIEAFRNAVKGVEGMSDADIDCALHM